VCTCVTETQNLVGLSSGEETTLNVPSTGMMPILLNTYLKQAAHYLQNSMSLHNRLFISSDDLSALLSNLLSQDQLDSNEMFVIKHWNIITSRNIPKVDTAGMTKAVKAVGKSKLLLYRFQQIMMALECDAWVGTRASSLNSLVDELRCVWIAKCHSPFVEIADTENWKDYGW